MTTLNDTDTTTRAAHLGPRRRRPQVLDAALAIVVERGVGEVTVGAIAERLGVTRPVIYACFTDRVDVVYSLLAREAAVLRDELVESLHSGRGTTAEAAFVAGFVALLQGVERRPDSWRVLLATPDPAVAHRYTRIRAQLGDALAARIQPSLPRWWTVDDADRTVAILVEFTTAAAMAAARSLLDPSSTDDARYLGHVYGRMVSAACRAATESVTTETPTGGRR